jgi:hypothetical protein
LRYSVSYRGFGQQKTDLGTPQDRRSTPSSHFANFYKLPHKRKHILLDELDFELEKSKLLLENILDLISLVGDRRNDNRTVVMDSGLAGFARAPE